jgi:hypothetical protein
VNTAQIIFEMQKTRSSLIDMINTRFDCVIAQVINQENLLYGAETVEPERRVPINANPSIFRKQKPIAIMFGEERIAASAWKDVYRTILFRCNQDPTYHDRLMNLRGSISAKGRPYLFDKREGMTHPTKIDEDLFAETHYSSCDMMRILVQRILAVIQYDYSNINIVLRT